MYHSFAESENSFGEEKREEKKEKVRRKEKRKKKEKRKEKKEKNKKKEKKREPLFLFLIRVRNHAMKIAINNMCTN